ncbi:Gfo/Idh/MocA family protein [Sphingomonas sp. ERG5]|uniref:Gfo/Idh/MocA family protein n=1 Tax=Sphingomonas sp. ERG5 TaxID=1381597 RepID=UPI00054BE017|nr:Gfo/Idh/MocA family oxidoreductase [Sphingomonas sp. ERG5]
MGDPPGIGVIGCGMVSHAYLGTVVRSPDVVLKALSSRTMESAAAQAARYGGEAMTTEALLADPGIQFVVNLAPPTVHHAIGRQVLEAGKHLYSEKPFAISLDEAEDLLALAEAKGLLIGCAPDTFLGEGHQTARRLLDDGAIGRVVGGSIAMASRGMESWHPDPAFFYARGGGPLLDIGPYYLTQLVNLLGPVAEVTAIGTRARDIRTITAPGREGETIAVDVPTNVNGALLFESGANIALTLSWDVWKHVRAPIELYGDNGTLLNPDPNQFGGAVKVSVGDGDWSVTGDATPAQKFDTAILAKFMAAMKQGIDLRTGRPLGRDTALNAGDRRGLGLLDLVAAVAEGRAPRASGRLATHVLDVLLALESSALGAGRVAIRSRVERPASVTGRKTA